MRCRRVICAACCTRIDGVNHCHACLLALAKPPPPNRTVRLLWPVTASLLLVAGWLFLFGLCWLTQGRLAP
jgi:hypothetical protein